MFCGSLFVLLTFFFWPLCCLSFFFFGSLYPLHEKSPLLLGHFSIADKTGLLYDYVNWPSFYLIVVAMPRSDGNVKCNDGIHCFPESSYCDKYQACTDGTDSICTVKFRGRRGRDRVVVGFRLPVQSVPITTNVLRSNPPRRDILDTTLLVL